MTNKIVWSLLWIKITKNRSLILIFISLLRTAMKMFTKSVKKVVNVSLLCSVSYGFILEDFFDKADNLGHLYSQGQLHSRDPFGNPLENVPKPLFKGHFLVSTMSP